MFHRFAAVSLGVLTMVAFAVVGSRAQPPGVEAVSPNPHDWPMFGRDPRGTRHNIAEDILSPQNVGDLEVVWEYDTDGPVAGTPVVVNDVVYAADLTGTVYAVRRDGQLLWRTTLNVPTFFSSKVGASPLVTNHTLVIGDSAGQIHGLDVKNGSVRWTTRPGNGLLFPEGHPLQAIYGAGTMVGKYVAFGVSSWEWLAPALFPDYPGFTFRGNVVLIDPADGRIVWQTFFVDEPGLQPEGYFGPSGATVWGSPAYDRASNTIFVGTGQNYELPTTDTSDAIIALDAETGDIKWFNQRTAGDHWNFTYVPENPDDPLDYDIGDSPQLYRLNGRLVVAAGQKSGFFHVLDAETGEEIADPEQYAPGGLLGGFHIDSAAAYGVNYAPANYWDFFGGPPEGGAVFAISGDGSTELWSFPTASPIISGVAIANDVVYVQELNGTLHALDAITGEQLVAVETGGQMSGPSISHGQIYVGTGDILGSVFINPVGEVGPGSIVALGLK